MSENWRSMTAADLGRAIAKGSIDPVALTEVFLEAAATDAAGSRSYARLTPDRARAEATHSALRAKEGKRRGPLDGVPISWKDLFDTKGTLTEAGSLLLQGRVPTQDAQVLRNAEQAGLICLGKTHMSELAFAGLGYNPMTDTPLCVNDPEAVPGGSSSGAASSVAFGLAAIGIGSDTGGSVRVPAAWNDLVGLKTTSGLLSLDGVVPLCSRFDTVGPLTRSVEDAALMLAALSAEPATDIADQTLDGVRFAVLESIAQDDLDETPGKAFSQALRSLERAGSELVALKAPEVAEAMALAGVLYTTEAYATWGDVIEASPDKMFDRVRERFLVGAEFSGAEYLRAWSKLEELRRIWAQTTQQFDAVVLPTSPNMPPNKARVAQDADYYVSQNLTALRNTRIGNLMGLSALTLPTGVPSCGLMLMGPAFGESALLRLGVAAEAAMQQS